jgi:hypothetical protein
MTVCRLLPWGAVLAVIVLLSGDAPVARRIGHHEAAQARGGVFRWCVTSVSNSSNDCRDKRVTENLVEYRCTGNSSGGPFDQFCPLATTNTGNYCDTGTGNCGGTLIGKNLMTQEESEQGPCNNKVQYQTARVQGGTCAVAPP